MYSSPSFFVSVVSENSGVYTTISLAPRSRFTPTVGAGYPKIISRALTVDSSIVTCVSSKLTILNATLGVVVSLSNLELIIKKPAASPANSLLSNLKNPALIAATAPWRVAIADVGSTPIALIECVVDVEPNFCEVESKEIYLYRIAADLVIDSRIFNARVNSPEILC